MEIKVAELRQIFEMLMKHLEDIDCATIKIEEEYHWYIASEQVYDPTKEPNEFLLDQLSWDWERLQKMLQDEDLVVSYGLAWMAPILRYVGEKVAG